ncbi:hypothetical protein E0W80_09455 [Microbacterium sp. PI-1]|uniref:hypothetical protein n=1 Tax=unclassified Microbacterium TaxID=2609290 RepID=UPI001040607E|nr:MULTISPECIES: hypothetical protein [unclassified Microbacterium]TCJ23776.1 hypothetical protein E0W80_09455 [Microbacterium sp. PI-1]UUE20086.1 hypothetical protein LRQ07_15005 [Microbacterium sp. J1-1]
MIRTLSATLALALVLAAGAVATLPEPAVAAAPAVKTAVPDRSPDGAAYAWHKSNLRAWSGTHGFGTGTRWGHAITAPAGSLAFRVEYPGVIDSAQVVGGPWRIEAQDLNSFTITNTQAVHTGSSNAASVQVSGQFDRGFVVPSVARGDQNVVDIVSSAHVL